MERTAVLMVAFCLVAWAASDAAGAPKPAVSLKPQTLNLDADAITIPMMLSYQGKLTDTLGQPVADTTYGLTFGLYTQPTGGGPFWTETQTVTTQGGLFSVLLGSVTPIGSVPDAGAAYLGMAVGWGLELVPRLRIASAAYAYLSERAANADLLQGKDTTELDGRYVKEGQGNSVTSAMVVNGTIAASDLGQMGASSGQVLKWNGSAWQPRNDSVGGGSIPDSIPGSLAIGGELRVHSKARLGYSCYNGGSAAFCAGYGNNASGDRASIAGGEDNSASGQFSHISGGSENVTPGLWATIGGGNVNEATDTAATVGGGRNNLATASHAAVAGGYGNDATGAYSFIGGGFNNTADTIFTTVGGGYNNGATGAYSFVGGGYNNAADTVFATVAGGRENTACSTYATVGGGRSDTASGMYATVAGGYYNTASAYEATVGGGGGNTASGSQSTVAGGFYNTASGYEATVGGGRHNVAAGVRATVPGGYYCAASGANSFATGTYAKARGAGSFVWSDSCGAGDSVRTTEDNRWVARARGGVYFYTNLGMTTGSYLEAGGSSWNSVSDSMTKENFRPVDKRALLEALARMRVRDYNLKSQDPSIRHIGPVAQDFYGAFGFGESNLAINMEDADGVALAAIQALYEDNRQLRQEVEALKAALTGRR